MHKQPQPTKELLVYFCLEGRMRFTAGEQTAYQNLRKGLNGEKKFASFLKHQLTLPHLALFDVLLENRGSLYQLDCLLIFPSQITLIEIKHFHGEFEMKHDAFFECNSGKEYRNPLHQLKRSTIYLRELLQTMRIKLPIQPQLVFNHPQFTLFEAKRNTPIVLPSQLPSFVQQLNQLTGQLGQHHHQLAEKIQRLHIPVSPYERLPVYQYEHLQKGILCLNCREKMRYEKKGLTCMRCKYRESLDSAILRNTIEFSTLFPDQKIQTSIIHEWCARTFSKRTISRILYTYLYPVKKGRSTQYLYHPSKG